MAFVFSKFFLRIQQQQQQRQGRRALVASTTTTTAASTSRGRRPMPTTTNGTTHSKGGSTRLHRRSSSHAAPVVVPEPAPKHVVIVGAGVSGLACAHHLLKLQQQQEQQPPCCLQITLVEASSRIGGRVWSSSGPGQKDKEGDSECSFRYDLGAELIHGRGTVLTDVLEELGLAGEDACLQDFCIVSHGDGGPTSNTCSTARTGITATASSTSISSSSSSSATTTTTSNHEYNNYYGRYYIDGQLRKASYPTVQALTDTLHEILLPSSSVMEEESVGEALSRRSALLQLNQQQQQQLQALAMASYGNTAGCTDLNQLSLPVLRHFHKHWEECEEGGDYHWPRPGMMSEWVDRWLEHLLMWNSGSSNDTNNNTEKDTTTSSTTTTKKIQILCDWPVKTIQKVDKEHSQTSFRVVSHEGTVLHADWVVVTVPPVLWPEMLGDLLTARKRTALPYIGFSRIVKVVCIFDQRLWPEGLQSLIVADRRSDRDDSLPIPEMWFNEHAVAVPRHGDTDAAAAAAAAASNANASTVPSQTQYIMVGFLMSQLADDFVAKIQQMQQDDSSRSNGSTNQGRSSARSSSREDAAATIVMEQMAHMFPWNSRADCHAALRHTLLSDWRDDAPHIRGGYMHPIRGMTVQHLEDLAAREQRLLFAGEATNTNACCTLQAAMETGVRAAGEIWEDLRATSSSQ